MSFKFFNVTIGMERVIYNPRGTIVSSYAWSLGFASNNVAKTYVLLQGLNLAKTLNA